MFCIFPHELKVSLIPTGAMVLFCITTHALRFCSAYSQRCYSTVLYIPTGDKVLFFAYLQRH